MGLFWFVWFIFQLSFFLKRGNKCTEKQTGCVAIANPKSKRQSKTNIHTKMMSPGGPDIYNFFCIDENQSAV